MMGKNIYASIAAEQRQLEELLCGYLMFSPERVALEASWLPPDNFTRIDLSKFWNAAMDSINPEDPTAGTTAAAIENGILTDLLKWQSYVDPSVSPGEIAGKIAEYSYLRFAYEKSQELVKAIADKDADLVRRLSAEMSNDDLNFGGKICLPSDISGEFKVEIAKPNRTIMTGIPDFDRMLGGLYPTELTLIFSRPGVGKTAIVWALSRSIAFQNKWRVLFLSLETWRLQLWSRMACPLAGLDWRDVRTGNISGEDKLVLAEVSDRQAEQLGDRLMVIDDVFTLAGIHRAVLKTKPDLVILDQLSEIKWHDIKAKKIEWYGEALRYIRREFARKLHIPVIVVHQGNRGIEERDNKRPVASDLRDSGELEQIADIVLGLYREDVYSGRSEGQTEVPLEVLPLKFRNGAAEPTILAYDLAQQWFN